MPRPLRFVPEHALVEITTRTLQGRLLLRPSPELNDLVLGIVGRAQDLGEGARVIFGAGKVPESYLEQLFLLIAETQVCHDRFASFPRMPS
jgi:hypothetical protein